MNVRSSILILAALAPAALGQTQRPVFQVGTDSVVLDVAVRHNDEPVLGLKQADFQILDNGVPQTVDQMSAETFPLDLTLVIDESGYGQNVIDRIKSAAAAAADLLSDDDQARIVAFNAQIQQVYEGSAAGVAGALDPIESHGRTSLYDALVTALARGRSPERRGLVVAFTVGIDTTSTTSPAILKEVARRSDTVLAVFLTYNPDPDSSRAGRWKTSAGEYDQDVKDAAETTGGFITELLGDDGVTEKLHKAVLDFRARYVLSYTIKNVAKPGWHDLTVKIKGHDDYQVLVRKGYDGGK